VDRIYSSVANFILVELKDIDAKGFQDILTPYKIMIRDCSNFDFLDSRFIRVAIKDSKSIDILEEALCQSSI
jgi:threonine-phosphate decarboxylase